MNKNITKSHTLIILDWDDTLFPTNWVMKNGINLLNTFNKDKYIIYFQELDNVLSRVLLTLSKYGKVIIVTNALPEWIKVSSIIMPKTFLLVEKIKVISARGIYQQYSSNVNDWKEMAFKNEVAIEFKNKKFINVISVGDAEYEYKALISLYKWNHRNEKIHKILKSIKFMKDPSHDVLIDQLEVLMISIPEISKKTTHLDLKFTHKKNI
jgi:hypothetical protein